MAQASIVFLDRDGTINSDSGYISSPDNVMLLEGAASGLAKLKQSGLRVVIVSNQSAIGRGLASHENIDSVNAKLCEVLRRENSDAVVDDIVYCPHHPDEGCCCRKPLTGLLQHVEFGDIGRSQCWIVGDKLSDLEFGVNAGFPSRHCLLVLTGDGETTLRHMKAHGMEEPRHCKNLDEAADLILDELG